MKLLLIQILVLVLASCERNVPFIPSESELVIAHFINLLSIDEIDYMRDDEGYFITDLSVEALESYSDKAHERASNSHTIHMKSQCQLDKLIDKLNEEKVVYVLTQNEPVPFVVVGGSDNGGYRISGYAAMYDSQCAPNA